MNRQAVLRRRLLEIIDAVFDGNVKAAASAAGISQPTLHKIVTGRVKESKGSTVDQLAEGFGVPPSWLRGDTDLLPEETPGGAGPRWLNLIRLYSNHSQQSDRVWLEENPAGQDHPIRKSLGWVEGDSDFLSTLDKCFDAALLRDPRLTEGYRSAVRAFAQAETQILHLAVNELRRAAANER